MEQKNLPLIQLLMLRKCYKKCIVVTVEFHFPPYLFIFYIIGLLFNYPHPSYTYHSLSTPP